MFNFKHYIVVCMVLYGSLFLAMNKDHIVNKHAYDSTCKYDNLIENKATGFLSFENKDGSRTTLFPKCYKRKDVATLVEGCSKHGKLLFQTDTEGARTIECRKEGKHTLALVKSDDNFIITSYPIFRHISPTELSNKNSVCIGVENKKDINLSGKNIKSFVNKRIESKEGLLAVYQMKAKDAKTGKAILYKKYFVDISKDIFGKDVGVNHVIVEIDKK